MNQYVENVAVRIDCSPEPEFLSTDGDDDFIHVPLVFRPWPLFANATGKMAAEAINPKSNRFPADNHASLGKQIFHIGGAQCKPMIGPNRISDNLTRKSKPLQPGK